MVVSGVWGRSGWGIESDGGVGFLWVALARTQPCATAICPHSSSSSSSSSRQQRTRRYLGRLPGCFTHSLLLGHLQLALNQVGGHLGVGGVRVDGGAAG